MSTAAGAPGIPKFSAAIVPLLGLVVFVNYVDRGILGTAAPLIKDQLHLTSTQIGLLTSAFFWTYTPAQLLAGYMTERLNAYLTLALGLALWASATFATGFATSFASIFLARLVLGIGESAAFPTTSKLIAQHIHGHRLGVTNAIISQGLSLGPAFGVFFGGLIMARFGWRPVFVVFGAISLLWLAPWLVTTHSLSRHAGRERRDPAPSFSAILSRRELWGASLGHLASNYGFYFVIAWMPLYLVKARGYSIGQMATIGGLVYLTFAAAALLSGLAVDRWTRAGAKPGTTRKSIGLVCFVVAAVALVACGYGGRQISLVSLFVAAFALGGLAPHVFAIGQILAGPQAAGKWTGVQNCFGNLSGIVGPVVTGMLIDGAGGYHAAFVLAAVVTLSGIVGWILLVPRIAPLNWETGRYD